MVLRPYQETCLDACLDALKSGCSRIGVSLPTGSGKTAVFISLLSRLSPPSVSGAKSSLIIVNNIELVKQAAVQAKRIRPDWFVEIEQGVRHATGLADVTVATYQTLLRSDRLLKFNPKSLQAVIVDEAHHAAAPSYRRILSYFNSEIQSPESTTERPSSDPPIVPIVGFSATFSRHDGLALGSVFEKIVYHQDFLQMVKDQWLCNVRFTTVRANLNLKNVTINSRTGDFQASKLAHVMNTETVNNLVVQTWLDRAGDRKSTLVFCVNVAHVRALTRVFQSAGVDARYLYSGTPVVERHALIEGFKKGEFPVLVNCAILTEGTDIPNVDCVLVARPTRSRNVFAQIIGRGMRLSPDTGKDDCMVIDFVDIINRVPGIVCTPTLFGLDPHAIVDDASTEELEERALKVEIASEDGLPIDDSRPDVPEPTSVTYVDYGDPFSLVKHASSTPTHISQISRNAWVSCGDNIYVLECIGKGHIRIQPGEDKGMPFTLCDNHFLTNDPAEDGEKHFEAHFAPHVLTAATLSDAVHGCDTYAEQKVMKGGIAMGQVLICLSRRLG
ncbi:hypothetical protein EWM64_g1369 [Hericium alpestre]|uniref:P-loop containing nucleoside triphosphate hydrolase protein n=1 Tax=Hericium alpestre TaxID=135208 RepID=A0A4Z0A6H1_9AGAM|nr:hypothetical protein EWM64_g1369 [Hericium alpestre]